MFKVIPITALAVVVGGQITEASGEHEVPKKFKTDPKQYFEELGQQILPDLQAIEDGYSFRQVPGFSVGIKNKNEGVSNTGSVIPQLADPVVTWEIWQAAMGDRRRKMGADMDVDPTTLVPRAMEAFRKTMLQVRDGEAAEEQIKEASTYMAASVDHMMAHLGLELPAEAKADFLSRIAHHWDEEASKLAIMGAKKDAVLATQSTASLIAAMARGYLAEAGEGDVKVTVEVERKRPVEDIAAPPPRFAQVPAGSRSPPRPSKVSQKDKEMLEKQRASLKARDAAKKEADDAFIRATLSEADALTYTGEGPAGLSMGLFTADGPYAKAAAAKGKNGKKKPSPAEGKRMVDGTINPALTAELLRSSHAPPVIEGVPDRVFDEQSDIAVSDSSLGAIFTAPSRTEPSFQEMAALQARLVDPATDKFAPVRATANPEDHAEELIVAPHEIDNELLEQFGGVADIAAVDSEIVLAFMQRHTALAGKKKSKKSNPDTVEVIRVGLADDSLYDAEEQQPPAASPKRLRSSSSASSSPSFRQNKLTIVQLPSKQQLKEREAARQVKAKRTSPNSSTEDAAATGKKGAASSMTEAMANLFSSFMQMGSADVFEINRANSNLSLKEQNERILAYVEDDKDI